MAAGSIKKVSNDSASNYCKMPDGTLIQWGQGNIQTTAGSSVNKTINFSQAFNNVNYIAIGLNPNTGDPITMTASAYTDTSMRVNVKDIATTTRYFTWFVIGRWK